MADVLTNAGVPILSGLASGASTVVPKYIGWGTGAGTAAKTDTTLFTAAAEPRITGTCTRVTTTIANDTIRVVGTLTSLSAQTITNVGLFDSVGSGVPPSGGTLVAKKSFTGQVLGVGESIQITFDIPVVN